MGVVPKTVFNYMLAEPSLISQYPGVESCLLAVPPIFIFQEEHPQLHPHVLTAGGGLTDDTGNTIGPVWDMQYRD